jgi:hypothetical protein
VDIPTELSHHRKKKILNILITSVFTSDIYPEFSRSSVAAILHGLMKGQEMAGQVSLL